MATSPARIPPLPAITPLDEPQRAALAVGLRYVSDVEPGIRRKGSGRGFAYYAPDGTLIKDREALKRIRSLVIPPAWQEVWICALPNGHIQVTARDAKGRKQYRYHPRFRAVRDETKFDRMLHFSAVLPRLRARVERDMARPGLPRDKILATVVRLLDKTLIRIGNDEYARDNQSFGLTTMRRRHVEISGAKVTFEFRGKSGVEQSISVVDRRIAKIVQRCAELPGYELFQYLDNEGKRQSIGAEDINEYLRRVTRRAVTAKDFRTWAGTMRAAAYLRDLGLGESERESKKKVVQAIDRVASKLGNTRTVCRKYYVHPAIIDAYLDGHLVLGPKVEIEPHRRERDTGALRREEIAVLEFLQQRLDEEETRRISGDHEAPPNDTTVPTDPA